MTATHRRLWSGTLISKEIKNLQKNKRKPHQVPLQQESKTEWKSSVGQVSEDIYTLTAAPNCQHLKTHKQNKNKKKRHSLTQKPMQQWWTHLVFRTVSVQLQCVDALQHRWDLSSYRTPQQTVGHVRAFANCKDLQPTWDRGSRHTHTHTHTRQTAHLDVTNRMCAGLTMSWWKVALRWEFERGKTDVGDWERRCHRDREGPPPQTWSKKVRG